MRTLNEIGKVLLANQNLFGTGLCRWLSSCCNEGLITEEEWEEVYVMLSNGEGFTGRGYYLGGKGKIQGRIEWINNNLINSSDE